MAAIADRHWLIRKTTTRNAASTDVLSLDSKGRREEIARMLSGAEVTAQLKAQLPELSIVVLTVYNDAEHIFKALRAGAGGYLLKQATATEILEAIADAAMVTKDPDAITEAVRGSIGRAICRAYQTEKGELPVIGVAPVLEERLLASLVRTDQGAVLALDPQQAQNIASRIARALEQAVTQPVLLCSPALRPHLWRLFARLLPHLGVLSHSEVPAHVPVDVLPAPQAAQS